MSYKDIWFAEFERLCNEHADERGYLSPVVEDELSKRASQNVNERLADQADMARKRAREEG